MKVPELSNVQYSLAKLPTDLEKYSNAGKFSFIDLFPSLHGPVIYLDPDVIVQGIHYIIFQITAFFSKVCLFYWP